MRQLVTGRLDKQSSPWRDQLLRSDQLESSSGPSRDEDDARPKSTLAGCAHKAGDGQRTPTRRTCSALDKSSVVSFNNSIYASMLSQRSDSNLEALVVESWLDDHPSFTHDYFMRKAPRQMLDDWLLANVKVNNSASVSSQQNLRSLTMNSSTQMQLQHLQQQQQQHQQQQQQQQPLARLSLSAHLRCDGQNAWTDSQNTGRGADASGEPARHSSANIGFADGHAGGLSCARAARSNSQSAAGVAGCRVPSGSLTPIRKISATDFETKSGSGFLRPVLSKTPDGRLTFLPQTNFVESATTTKMGRHLPERTGACHVSKKSGHDQSSSRASSGGPSGAAVADSDWPGGAQSQNGLESWPSQTAAGQVRACNATVGLSDEHTTCEPANRRPADHTGNGDGQDDRDGDASGGGEGARGRETDCATRAAAAAAAAATAAAAACDGDHNRQQDDDDEDNHAARASAAHDEAEVRMIFELVKNIYDDLDIRTLFYKILKNIAVLINADRSSLFLVCGGPGDPNRRLVSQLFNIDQDSLEVCDTQESITIPWGVGLVGYVAESGESVNIVNCYEDARFTDAIDQRTGYVTRHMLCAPILDKRNEIVGVAQVINKRDGNPFSKNDETKFKRYLQFCGIGLRNAQSYEQCQLENRRNQVLLDLARMVFEEQSTIEQVVHRIMLHTQSLLDCERCQVLLIDNGSDELDGLLQAPTARTCCDQGLPPQPPPPSSATSSKQTKWRPQCSKQWPHWVASCGAGAQEATVAGARAAADECEETATTVPADDDCRPAPTPLGAPDASGDADLTREHAQEPFRHQSARQFSLVFDLECDGNEDPVIHDTRSGADEQPAPTATLKSSEPGRSHRAFPINIGITGYVATTGETLNIADAHEHERFDASVDEDTDFRHKSILCMPIRNGQRQIIGVIQLINKKNGQPFNTNDENLFEAFAIFCGLGIHNTLMYERVLKVMAKQRVTFEVLSYHATAPLEEAKKLSQEQVPSCFALNLASLKFNDFSLDEQYMLKSCLRFFLDLDLMRRFQIDQLVFCNWILSVQKNYRKVTYHPVVGGHGLKASPVRYHNWRHAFNVSQMMFAILVNTQICHSLGELETLALLIACLCHDLDHRGTNNSFQIKSASPLAELYSTSTMEHHHFDQCVMILNSQGNQILSNLSPAEYSRVIMLLKEAILATDLANYFQKRDHFFQLVNSGRFDWRADPGHRSILRCMMMTACDVAAITKPWPVQKVVADLVMSEFYQQGDIERNELKIEPSDMMNRDKLSELPTMQISFIDTICAPIYTAFAKLFPEELGTLLDGCLTNRTLWREVVEADQKPEIPSISYLNCDIEPGSLEANNERSRDPLSRANITGSKSESNIPRKLLQLSCGNDVIIQPEKSSLSLSLEAFQVPYDLYAKASQETMIATNKCGPNYDPCDTEPTSTVTILSTIPRKQS